MYQKAFSNTPNTTFIPANGVFGEFNSNYLSKVAHCKGCKFKKGCTLLVFKIKFFCKHTVQLKYITE